MKDLSLALILLYWGFSMNQYSKYFNHVKFRDMRDIENKIKKAPIILLNK